LDNEGVCVFEHNKKMTRGSNTNLNLNEVFSKLTTKQTNKDSNSNRQTMTTTAVTYLTL
jgi:hypothetical protein